MSKLLEKARRAVLGSKKNTERPIVDDSMLPGFVAKPGSRVRISHGDILDDAGVKYEGSVAGTRGRVDGRPYVAVAGPNKGKVIQPVTIEGTSTLVGVPQDRLSSADSGHASARVGWSPKYENAYERIFGRR